MQKIVIIFILIIAILLADFLFAIFAIAFESVISFFYDIFNKKK